MSDIIRVARNSQAKRNVLLDVAETQVKNRSLTTLASGMLALFAAATLSSVIIASIDSFYLQALSLGFAFTGGILGIASSFHYNYRDLVSIHSGASKFLGLREKALALPPEKSDIESE
ncbi:MAG: hypothetical protein ABW168_05655 [Sedimenticola sp.]